MELTVGSQNDTAEYFESKVLRTSAEQVGEKSPKIPRSTHPSQDEQIVKKIDNVDKAKSAMTPRQARRIAANTSKDIEQEFRDRDGSNDSNFEQKIRFVDSDNANPGQFKKRRESSDSENNQSSKDQDGDTPEVVEEIIIPKKNRNRVKSESHSRTLDNPKKSKGQSLDALDLEDLGDYVKNVAKSMAMRNSAEKERSAVHKVRKHKNRNKSKDESDEESDSYDDSDESGRKSKKRNSNKRDGLSQVYSGQGAQFTVPSQQVFQGQQMQTSNFGQSNHQPLMYPYGYGYQPQHPAFMSPNSFGPPQDFMPQNQAWNSQQSPDIRQKWMQNYGFPYFPPNSPEKDLSVRNGTTGITGVINQEVSSGSGIVRNKSGNSIVTEVVDITELTPNPPKSPPPKPALKSPRKDTVASKESEILSADSETSSVRKADMSSPVEAFNGESKAVEAEKIKTETLPKVEAKVESIQPSKTEQATAKTESTVNTTLPLVQMHAVGSVAHNLATSIPGVVSQEKEFVRLSAMYSLGILNDKSENPRLNKITQMTAKLLGRSCCVLSLVDTDKVYWKSVAWTGLCSPKAITEEPRYESFCSWVVQDETGRGVTILDAKTDPRCAHMRLKQGLEFYAGVPILLGGKHKIGALSVQGPTASQISVVDMNILHEMASWASGELDTIIQQKQLNDRENLLRAREKLSVLSFSVGKENMDPRIMEKSLAMLRDALNAQFVLMLKLNPDPKGFQSVLQVYSVASNAQTSGSLPVGEEMFKELCMQTLKKENNSCLLIENLKTGAITKDVDRYLNKNINRCMGEIIWSSNGPSAVLALFFDGVHRIISQDELKFVQDVIPAFSTMLEQQELKESLQQAATVYKTLGSAAKKHTIAFGASQGLAPCFLILEPKMTTFKGYPPLETIFTFPHEKVKEAPILPIHSGAKGQALAEQIAQNDFPLGGAITESRRLSEPHKIGALLPIESFEVINDLTNMLDSLSEKHGLKKPRRFGQQYYVVSNYGPDTGTFENSAAFAQELLFTLDTYNQTKKRKVKVQIGIHTDFLSLDLVNDSAGLKDQLISIANGAYQLESRAESILVSEIFYHQTKDFCSYEQGNPMIIRGQGGFSTYKFIGLAQNTVKAPVIPMKENGINNKGSMIVSKIPYRQVAPETILEQPSAKTKKKERCIIL